MVFNYTEPGFYPALFLQRPMYKTSSTLSITTTSAIRSSVSETLEHPIPLDVQQLSNLTAASTQSHSSTVSSNNTSIQNSFSNLISGFSRTKRALKTLTQKSLSSISPSEKTSNLLIGLIARRQARFELDNREALAVFKSKTPPTPINDNTEQWAAKMGGKHTGTRSLPFGPRHEGEDPTFGVAYRYRHHEARCPKKMEWEYGGPAATAHARKIAGKTHLRQFPKKRPQPTKQEPTTRNQPGRRDTSDSVDSIIASIFSDLGQSANNSTESLIPETGSPTSKASEAPPARPCLEKFKDLRVNGCTTEEYTEFVEALKPLGRLTEEEKSVLYLIKAQNWSKFRALQDEKARDYNTWGQRLERSIPQHLRPEQYYRDPVLSEYLDGNARFKKPRKASSSAIVLTHGRTPHPRWRNLSHEHPPKVSDKTRKEGNADNKQENVKQGKENQARDEQRGRNKAGNGMQARNVQRRAPIRALGPKRRSRTVSREKAPAKEKAEMEKTSQRKSVRWADETYIQPQHFGIAPPVQEVRKAVQVDEIQTPTSFVKTPVAVSMTSSVSNLTALFRQSKSSQSPHAAIDLSSIRKAYLAAGVAGEFAVNDDEDDQESFVERPVRQRYRY